MYLDFFIWLLLLNASIAVLYMLKSEYPIEGVLYLIIFFCCISAVLFLLDLSLFAYVIMLIYVGAVAVLFLFTVMMVGIDAGMELDMFYKKKEEGTAYLLTASDPYIQNFTMVRFLERVIEAICWYGVCVFFFNLEYVFGDVERMLLVGDLSYKFQEYGSVYSFDNLLDLYGIALYVTSSYQFMLALIILCFTMVGVITLTMQYRIQVNMRKQHIYKQTSEEALSILLVAQSYRNR